MKWLLLVYVFLVFVEVIQRVIRWIIHKLNKRIQENMESLLVQYKDDEEMIEAINKELTPFSLVQEKQKSLGFITRIISYIEFILIFSWSLLVAFDDEMRLDSGIQLVALAVSGWLAIKVIGSYQQWSGAIWGRATFYVFLIGSLVNVLIAASIPFVLIVFYRMHP